MKNNIIKSSINTMYSPVQMAKLMNKKICKNKLGRYSIFCLLLFFTTMFSFQAKASHIMGGDFSYKLIDSTATTYKFKITLSLYRDCSGINYGSEDIIIRGSGVNQTVPIAFVKKEEVTQICLPPDVPSKPITNCPSGPITSIKGVERWIYEREWTFTKDQGYYLVSWTACCRNASITTCQNPSGQASWIQCVLSTDEPNNSVVFTRPPIQFWCKLTNNTYNHGAIDSFDNRYIILPSGKKVVRDSFEYTTYTPFNGGTANVNLGANLGNPSVTFNTGLNNINFLYTTNGVTIDPISGSISCVPDRAQDAIMAMCVKEYRAIPDNSPAGYHRELVGYICRDMQFTVRDQCDPIATPGVIEDSLNGAEYVAYDEIDVCWNGNANGIFTIVGPDSQNLKYEIIQIPNPNSVVNFTYNINKVSGGSADTLYGSFSFDSSTGVGTELLQVRAYYCTSVGISVENFYTLKINLKDSIMCTDCYTFTASLNYSDSCILSNDVTISTTVDSSFGNITYLWSSGETTSSISNKTTGWYFVTITDTVLGCNIIDSIYVEDDNNCQCTKFTVSLNANDDCSSNDVTINSVVSNIIAGTYTYIWSSGENTSSIINKTTGTYTLIVSDTTNGCLDSATISIIDSTFKCCRANFNSYDSLTVINFNSTSWTTPSDSIINYNWSFGNGTTGTGINTSQTYPTNGNYTICHYIETASGCKDTNCITKIIPQAAKNLKVLSYGGSYILGTMSKYTVINYQNIGNTVEYPTIEYIYPDSCSYDTSSKVPTSNIGNKLTFNIGALNPGTSGSFYVYLNVPSTFTIGSLKCDTTIILPLANDINVTNNTSISCRYVVSSYDPNEKTSSPTGEGQFGNISPDTKELNYLIRFQNEGNHRTYKVRIEDEIDPSLDISSLLIGDITHESRMVVNGNKLTWYFDDINLSPKDVDEANSSGYISYSLKLKDNLPLGKEIRNTAHIFFDYNPAIITNTTVHTLKASSASNSIVAPLDNNQSIKFNRNNNLIELNSSQEIKSLEVFDLNGRKIYKTDNKFKKLEVDISGWPESIYLFNLETDSGVNVIKFKF